MNVTDFSIPKKFSKKPIYKKRPLPFMIVPLTARRKNKQSRNQVEKKQTKNY